MKRYVTNRELVIKYKGQMRFPNWEGEEIHIPAGHPVKHVGYHMVGYPNPKRVMTLYAGNPSALLDAKTQSMLLHDATYYGIPIPEDAVTEC